MSGPRAGLGLAVLAVLASGCRQAPADAVAVFNGGAVIQADLDRRIRSLPVEERRPADGDVAAWRERLIRELATEKILLAAARAVGGSESSERAAALLDIERQAAVTVYLETHLQRPPRLQETEVRQAYEDWKADYAQADRRLVFHLFRRIPSTAAAGQVGEEMQRLRQRVLAGESFRLLAAEHSESETRHREGLMGWFGRGQLAAGLEKVVFELPVQAPSEPIRTTSGYHMFWVETAVVGKQFPFEEVRALVARRLTNARLEQQARAMVRVQPPAGSFVPTREALATLLQAGDPQALILRVGDYELRAGELRRRLAEAAGGGVAPSAVDVVHGLELRELLYLQCREEGCERTPEVALRVAAQRERAATQQELRRQLLERIRGDRQRLAEFYERNRGRYAEPVRWRLSRAVLPLGADPNARMAVLEEARPALDAGERRLEEVVTGLGGRMEATGWQPLAALQAESFTLGLLVPQLEPGRHSAPFRRGEALEMVRCEERLEPVPLPLERVEDRVAQDILLSEGQEEYREFAAQALERHGFRLVGAPGPEGLTPGQLDRTIPGN